MFKLEPGTYRLKSDVHNPNPDRRCRHDWRKRLVWKAGSIFRVETKNWFNRGDVCYLWSDGHSFQSFSQHEDGYEALALELEKLEEKPSDWLRRQHSGLNIASGILDALFESGKINMDDLEVAAKKALSD